MNQVSNDLTDEFDKNKDAAATNFYEVWINSWKLSGANNTPSIRALETPGMQAAIVASIFNTYAMTQSEVDEVIMTVGGDEVRFSIKELELECNKQDCDMEVIADNGDVVNKKVDFQSSVLNNLYRSANYIKEQEEAKTLSLTK